MSKRNLLFLGFLALVAGIAALLFSVRSRGVRLLPPSFFGTVIPSPAPLPSFTYKDIQPGTTTENQVAAALGPPIRKERGGVGSTLVYPSGIGTRPLLVQVDSAGTTALIKEPVLETINYGGASRGLGEPNLVLYGHFVRLGFRLFVYLPYGVAFLANPDTQETRERWYFPPDTNATVFQRVFAPEFQLTPPPLDQE